MDIYTKLARQTIDEYITHNKLPDLANLPAELRNKKAGCFVSLHQKDGNLRGCIGTIEPVYKNLGSEIVSNAIAASQNDPRFKPVTKEELKDLQVSVDILNPPEIASEKELDPKKYGVIVQAPDGRDGLLLPDIEGVDSAAEQIAIARQKAGIAPNENVSLFRFTVDRHNEL